METNEFKSLPLTEVELKLTLSAPIAIILPVAIDFHDHIKERFPIPLSTDTLILAPGGQQEKDIPTSRNMLAAIEFANEKLDRVVRLQQQMLSIKWNEWEDGDPYPRYEQLNSDLTYSLDVLVKRAPLASKPIAVQIKYHNFVRSAATGEPPIWFLKDQYNVALDVFSTGPYSLNVSGTLGAVVPVDVAIRVNAAHREGHGEGFLFETVAGKSMSEQLSDVPWDEALRACHDQINLAFRGIMSDAAIEEWKYQGS